MKQHQIKIQPHLTEKALASVKRGVYTFKVSAKSSKTLIKKTVTDMFGVEVGSVKTIINKGKNRRVGKKMKIKKLIDEKIAFITVTKGKIDLFPQG